MIQGKFPYVSGFGNEIIYLNMLFPSSFSRKKKKPGKGVMFLLDVFITLQMACMNKWK